MHEVLLSLVQCPVTRRRLRVAGDDLICQINDLIQNQGAFNHIGQLVERKLDAGLVNEDDSLLYPIYDGVPWLMQDEAIPLK